jgi:hypothetical protein
MVRALVVAVIIGMSGVLLSAQGPQPANALTDCLANNTSGKDRKDLAKWIFFAMAAHPEMKQYATSIAGVVDDNSRTVAALVTRLLTDACVNETRATVAGGQSAQAVQAAFAGLGGLAMRELMSDPSVQDAMTTFQRYFDQKKLIEAITPK